MPRSNLQTSDVLCHFCDTLRLSTFLSEIRLSPLSVEKQTQHIFKHHLLSLSSSREQSSLLQSSRHIQLNFTTIESNNKSTTDKNSCTQVSPNDRRKQNATPIHPCYPQILRENLPTGRKSVIYLYSNKLLLILPYLTLVN